MFSVSLTDVCRLLIKYVMSLEITPDEIGTHRSFFGHSHLGLQLAAGMIDCWDDCPSCITIWTNKLRRSCALYQLPKSGCEQCG